MKILIHPLLLTLLVALPCAAAESGTHRKILLEGEPATSGEPVDPVSYAYTLATSGKIFFRANGGWYSGKPGEKPVRQLIPKMPAPGGRYFTDLSYSFRSEESIAAGGGIAFIGETVNPAALDARGGLFLLRDGRSIRIAQDGETAPGGGLYDFSGAETPRVSNNGKYVAFRVATTGAPGGGLFLATAGSSSATVKAIYTIGQSSPDGGQFTSAINLRSDEFAVNNAGKISFIAETSMGTSMFAWTGSKIIAVKGAGPGWFAMYNDPGSIVVNNDVDLATGTINGVKLTVKPLDPAPRGLRFSKLAFLSLGQNGDVAFNASLQTPAGFDSGSGVFIRSGGVVRAIAVSSDMPPGGGVFTDLTPYGNYPLPAGDGSVYFLANTSGGSGIFRGSGGKLTRVIGAGDQLEGRTVLSVSFDPSSLRVMAGQGAANATGQLAYYADLGDTEGFFLYTPPAMPEISVQQSADNELSDGKSNVSFGATKSAKRSKIFRIKNTGGKTLQNIKASFTGAHPTDFKIKGNIPGSLKSGADVNFKVIFKPKSAGIRSAVLKIRSNDADENPFEVKLSGVGK